MDIADIARDAPDKVAVTVTSGRSISYGELLRRSNQVAHLLYDAGLRRGDGIVLMLPNCIEFYELAWGAQRSGLYYTPVNTHLTADEIAYIIDDSGAKAVFIHASASALASELAASTRGAGTGAVTGVRFVVGGDLAGYDNFDEAMRVAPHSEPPEPSQGTEMLYSSGTTGRPKGVRRPLPGQEGSFAQSATEAGLRALYQMDSNSVYLSPAPLYHSAPLAYTMAVLRMGATAVVMERFDPEATLRLIEEYRVTHAQFVPTMFVRLLKLAPTLRSRYDISSLQCAIHAAAPCPVEVKAQMLEWWGPIIYEYYTGTEAIGGTIIGPEEWMAHPGSVGKPLSPVHILDEDGAELPTGQPGRIFFDGGAPFEYHNDPAKTASIQNDQGWRTLGDVGYVDTEGYLYLTDRATFMIVSGGVNIYPQEAENILVMHPKVADAAVFGVPNEEFGEEVKAVVQPLAWADAGDHLADELIGLCRSRLTGYKCPRTIDFIRELPRDPNGKLYKRRLRDDYWAGHSTRLL
jgi:long-chain acyl-CoA synthetase